MNAIDRVFWISVGLAILGFAMIAIALVGEHLGWWNDLGEVLLTAGSILSILATVIALLVGASRRQATRIAQVVTGNGRTLDLVTVQLASVDVKLDKLDKLDSMDEKLDVVHLELERQTGVLDRQVTILGEIRDGLNSS